jgi:hypothetical protein
VYLIIIMLGRNVVMVNMGVACCVVGSNTERMKERAVVAEEVQLDMMRALLTIVK